MIVLGNVPNPVTGRGSAIRPVPGWALMPRPARGALVVPYQVARPRTG